jgi:hypothetical protein
MRRGLDKRTFEEEQAPPQGPDPAPVLRLIEGPRDEGPEAGRFREEPRGRQRALAGELLAV